MVFVVLALKAVSQVLFSVVREVVEPLIGEFAHLGNEEPRRTVYEVIEWFCLLMRTFIRALEIVEEAHSDQGFLVPVIIARMCENGSVRLRETMR